MNRQNYRVLDPVAGIYDHEVEPSKTHTRPLNGLVIEELNGLPGESLFPKIQFDPIGNNIIKSDISIDSAIVNDTPFSTPTVEEIIYSIQPVPSPSAVKTLVADQAQINSVHSQVSAPTFEITRNNLESAQKEMTNASVKQTEASFPTPKKLPLGKIAALIAAGLLVKGIWSASKEDKKKSRKVSKPMNGLKNRNSKTAKASNRKVVTGTI